MQNTDFDVIVCGFGPVGQLATNLLGKAGHRVLAVEQWGGIFNLPRAAHFDHEVMRILQSADIAETLEPTLLGGGMNAVFYSASNRKLIEINAPAESKSGWCSDYFIHQPELERQLAEMATSRPGVEVRYNSKVSELTEDDDVLKVCFTDPRDDTKTSATTKFVIGADGANSFVRQHLDIEYEDLGFDDDWLVADIVIKDPSTVNLPDSAEQICDPKRAITGVPMPSPRWRCEFRMMPGDTKEDLESPDFLWRHFKRWNLTPDNSEIERQSVYTFSSKIARDWRQGRIFLAGDACHLTPPFLGQGMSMGMRDAKNLSWKIDHVLRGVADEKIFEAYTPERYPQVREAIDLALKQGAIICETNRLKATLRDTVLRTLKLLGKSPNVMEFPDLLAGILHKDQLGQPTFPAGDLFVQGRVDDNDQKNILLDDLIGGDFVLLGNKIDPLQTLVAPLRDFWRAIGGKTVTFDEPAGEDGIAVTETAGSTIYADWFDEHKAVAALMRPDFYTFGAARSVNEIGDLMSNLQEQLQAN